MMVSPFRKCTMDTALTGVYKVLVSRKQWLRERWTEEVLGGLSSAGRISDEELRQQTEQFLDLLIESLREDPTGSAQGPVWKKMRVFLEDVSRSRALQGFTASQTATFVFSFKRMLFTALNEEMKDDAKGTAAAIWESTELLDQLGLQTVQAFQKTREDLISRQQQEMLELSTPVVKLWDGVLALPMIGTLDSLRTQVVMETLLQRIVETGSQIAIIDITGVPTVDTLVAQHLLKTVTAIRLMGADCIISGVRPQIAQTIVHLGVDLGDVTTKATLADALALALKRSGFVVAMRAEGRA
jgi:rsbT co-antagonist protein RsbR